MFRSKETLGAPRREGGSFVKSASRTFQAAKKDAHHITFVCPSIEASKVGAIIVAFRLRESPVKLGSASGMGNLSPFRTKINTLMVTAIATRPITRIMLLIFLFNILAPTMFGPIHPTLQTRIGVSA
jgi:hypothetical protein